LLEVLGDNHVEDDAASMDTTANRAAQMTGAILVEWQLIDLQRTVIDPSRYKVTTLVDSGRISLRSHLWVARWNSRATLAKRDDGPRDRRKDALSNVFGVCSCIAEDGLSQAH